MTTCPVHVASDLTPEKIKALRIAYNRLHEESNWIEDLLKPELLELKGINFDLGLTGFGQSELAKFLPGNTALDNTPEPQIDNARAAEEMGDGPRTVMAGR
jgi:ParB-like chromosome segregation protein Spo0J